MGQSAELSKDDIDCCPLLDSAALDSIAEAGFGYKTNVSFSMLTFLISKDISLRIPPFSPAGSERRNRE